MGKIKKRVREKKASTIQRTALLTHNTKEKRETLKHKLSLSRVKRKLDSLRQRLEAWDPLKEEEKERQAKQQQQPSEPEKKKKKRLRIDPSQWKLKGAARPASQVYDFDTRYVDPYQAQEAPRTINLIQTKQNLLHHEVGRDYLETLMEYGHLNEQAQQYQQAQECYQQVIQHEQPSEESDNHNHHTTARDCLMELYFYTQQYTAASHLATVVFPHDTTVTFRYTGALAQFRLAAGKTKENTALQLAVTSNPFAAYWLCYHDTFECVFEHLEELQEFSNDTTTPQGSLEEAILYGASRTQEWVQTEGALEALQAVLSTAVWKDRLKTIRAQQQPHMEMYIGMFETAMEMVAEQEQQQAGRVDN